MSTPAAPSETALLATLRTILRNTTHNGNLGITYIPECDHFKIAYIHPTAMGNNGSAARLESERLQTAFASALKKAGLDSKSHTPFSETLEAFPLYVTGSAAAAIHEARDNPEPERISR